MRDDLYQEMILEEYAHPRHQGDMPDADVKLHQLNASCGDEVTVFLKFDTKKKKIADVKWQGVGCAISMAAASLVSDHVIGKTLPEVLALKQADVEALLGIEEISPGRKKCLLLSLRAVQKAIDPDHTLHQEEES